MKSIILLITAIFIFLPLALCDWQIYDEAGKEPYYWSGYVGDVSHSSLKVTLNNGGGEVGPQKGKSCAEIVYDPNLGNGAELYIQAKKDDWTRGPGRGIDFTGANNLIFWARGSNSGEVATFGLGYPTDEMYSGYGDSYRNFMKVTLTNYWKEYKFSLKGQDLTHINSPFFFKIEQIDNPVGSTFYLDNISYSGTQVPPPPLKVKIVSPIKNEHVGGSVVLQGDRSRDLVESEFLWVAVKPLYNVSMWFPQRNVEDMQLPDNKFGGNAYLDGDNGEKFEIAILLLDEDLNKKFLKYSDTSEKTGDWASITDRRLGIDQVSKKVIEAHKLDSVDVILDK